MHLSVLLSSLPLPFVEAVRQAAALGFTHVDVAAVAERPEEDREALAEAGVAVCCAAIGRGLPEGHTLDAADLGCRRAAVAALERHLADAAALGATHAYVVSGTDATATGLGCFAEACVLLADFAARRRLRLCVEHIPGRALAGAADTLRWLTQLDHPNLFLLLDVGHCLITGEDAAAVVRRAGPRLGFVHLDDNDGVGDLHWPLLTGRLTEPALREVLAALPLAGYDGALTLELSPRNADPVAALRQGRALVERLLAES